MGRRQFGTGNPEKPKIGLSQKRIIIIPNRDIFCSLNLRNKPEVWMKVQYFGDEHDFRKYVLLRLLAKHGFKIGVCWMLTPNDGRSDGEKRIYLDQGKANSWRQFDESLYDLLAPLVSKEALDRRALSQPTFEDLKQIELGGLIANAVYFERCVPQSRENRALFHTQCQQSLNEADLIFYDPENGLEVESCPKGRKHSIKYLYFDEITEAFRGGKSVLIYQHFPRAIRHKFIEGKMQQLNDKLPGSNVWAFAANDVVFLFAVHPNHSQSLALVERDFQILINQRLFKALHKQK
jgi:hypothetical protein